MTTIYNHFTSKGEILLTLAAIENENLEYTRERYEVAADMTVSDAFMGLIDGYYDPENLLRNKDLLLDEPLSALNKKLREAMQSELRHLQRALGITFVLVTHDQEEALTMSDRVAVMFDGELEQLATPQELYKRPCSRRVANFFGSMNILPASVLGEVTTPMLAQAPMDNRLRQKMIVAFEEIKSGF